MQFLLHKNSMHSKINFIFGKKNYEKFYSNIKYKYMLYVPCPKNNIKMQRLFEAVIIKNLF